MNIRAIFLTAAFGVAAIPLAQDLSKPISFDWNGRNLDQALMALSKQMGTTLKVPQNIKHEPIAIRVRERPMQELLEKMAEAIGGKWEKRNDGLWLMRTTQPDPIGHRIEWETKRITDMQQAARAEISHFRDFTDSHAEDLHQRLSAFLEKVRHEGDVTPGLAVEGRNVLRELVANRLHNRLFVAMDPVALAKSPLAGRTVFSSKPTRAQLPLSSSAIEAIRKAVSEQSIWQAKLEAKPVANVLNSDRPYSTKEQLRKYLFEESAAIPTSIEGIDKVNLVISSRDFNSQRGELRFYDKAGLLTSKIEFPAFLIREQWTSSVPPNTLRLPLSPKANEPIKFSPLVQAFLESKRLPRKSAPEPVDRANSLTSSVLEPDHIDVWSRAVSEHLLAVAKNCNLNLVFSPSDFQGFEGYLNYAYQGTTPQNMAQGLVNGRFGMEISITNGYLEIKERLDRRTPNTMFPSQRVSRQNLAAVLRKVQLEKYLSIESYGDYLLHDSDRYLGTNTLHIDALFSVVPDGIGLRLMAPPVIARLYASLEPMQLRALKESGRLEIAQLRSDQRNWLNAYYYSGRTGMIPWAGSAQSEGRVSLQAEPTEAFPNGLPSAASIKFDLRTEPYLQSMSSIESGSQQSFVPFRNVKSWRERRGPGCSTGAPTWFRTGQQRTLNFSLTIPRFGTAMETLSYFKPESSWVSDMSKLPAEAIRQIEAGGKAPN